jgi:hypothetical protein
MKRVCSLFFLGFLLLCCFTPGFAQTGTTSLRGTVSDKTGGVITGANVVLRSQERSFERQTSSDETGVYEFLSLPPGTYALTVESAGFRKHEQRDLELLVNNPATVNVRLEVGATSETIEVNAQAITLNATDASLGIAFGENQVKQLPLEGRNVPDLLSLQPGVVYTGNRSDVDQDTDTRSGAVNGARSDQTNVTLDGIPVNPKGGYAFNSVLPVTLDSVEEFRVTTVGGNADEGVSGGAQVALVTKSGTDKFHGSAYEYHRNTATSANDFFVKSAQIQTCENNGTPLSDKSCNQAPKLIRNIFGASLGGPLKKNRLYFFTNFEATRRAEQASQLSAVPSDAMKDGVIRYLCTLNTDGSYNTQACPGGSVTGLDGKSFPVPAGYYGLGPAALQQMDPQGIGVDNAIIKYLNTFPTSNTIGTGDGYNYVGYRFASPISDTKNWYIARLDYNLTADAKQRLSVSGGLANESNSQAPYLPGEPPQYTVVNFNKGIVANYSAVITPNLLNNFRYGFVRESVGNIGNSNQTWVYLRGLNDGLGAITRSQSFQRPTHNFYDDVSWTHGRHTWQFGVQISLLRDAESNYNNSYNDAVTNSSWIDTGSLSANSTSPFNPISQGFPAVDLSFANSYDYPTMALYGAVSQVDGYYNYLKNGSVQPEGAPVARNFAEDAYELYAQDVWKVKPNLTVTLGVRYSMFSPPWETNGLEVTPTINLGNWFLQRAANMMQGIPSNQDPLISFDLSGPANGGRPGYYNWDYDNLGPRVAVAYSPYADSGLLGALFGGKGESSIRAGFGIVYDRAGESLVDDFNTGGSYGLSTTLTTQEGSLSAATAPRVTDINTIPTVAADGVTPILVPAPKATFPTQFPIGLFDVQTGVDQNLKTPYSYTIDFSFGRELPSGFSLEVAYVGRLSHRLLTPVDLAMPMDLYDKKSGLDYFKAITALGKIYRSGETTDQFQANLASLPSNVQQYFADMVQPLVSGGAYAVGNCTNPNGTMTSTMSPVVAIYDFFCGYNYQETSALQYWDTGGIPDANIPGQAYLPTGGAYSFFNQQFASLYAWRSIGAANYHAMDVTLRHKMSHGLQFDFNYTFSKSIDMSSDAERAGVFGGLGGQVYNAWDPSLNRAVSDFDVTHQFNANWILDLPFGKGRRIAPDAHGALNAVIGGWQLSGLFRLTSGFPVNVSAGARYITDWQLSPNAFLTSPVKTGTYTVPATNPDGTPNPDAGAVNVFANGPAAVNSFRVPFPGEVGQRNSIRGPGYFGIDMGLAKRWTMPWSDKQTLQFRWEVFNITNSVRFDVQTGNEYLDVGNSFGNYSGLLTNPRVMQFALRYEF